MILRTLLCTMCGFVLGAIPFSVWLPRWCLGADVRQYGDGNPGSVNAWRSGGWRIGLPAFLLDYLKGVLPVGLAVFMLDVVDWGLLPVALAPVLGHAFSPFLKLRGGKAVAATFGVWTGLTIGEGPTILGLLVAWFGLVQTADAWAMLLGMLGLGAHLVLRHASGPILGIWLGNTLVIGWKHRRDLRRPVRLRPWIRRLLRL